jgi:hypothetical protein
LEHCRDRRLTAPRERLFTPTQQAPATTLSALLAHRLLGAPRMLRFLVLALFTVGCTDVAALTAENAALKARLRAMESPQPRYPVGDVFVPHGKNVDLGWLELRVREVKQCRPDAVGVAVEVTNRTAERLELGGYDPKLFDAAGAKAGIAFDFGSCGAYEPDVAAGGTTVMTFVFAGTKTKADLLELEMIEPTGLARYRVLLALTAATRRPKIVEPPRLPPAVPIDAKAGPLETNFYRFAVTDVKICKGPDEPGGAILAGVEIVLENRSNVPFRIGDGGQLRDGRGYTYDGVFRTDRGACGDPIASQELRPGDRARGFLRPFLLPPDAGALTLEYRVAGTWNEAHAMRLAIGPLPAAPPAPPAPPSLPTAWTRPKQTSVETNGIQVTVTDVKPCSERTSDGRMHLGVELLVENRSDKPIVLPWAGEVEDADHYHYRLSSIYDSTGPCNPILTSQKPLAPGEKQRGWLNAFDVPVGASAWKLHYSLEAVTGEWTPTVHTAVLELGVLR